MSDDTEMPEEVICYYPPGYISPLLVVTELYDKDCLYAEYVRKDTILLVSREEAKEALEWIKTYTDIAEVSAMSIENFIDYPIHVTIRKLLEQVAQEGTE